MTLEDPSESLLIRKAPEPERRREERLLALGDSIPLPVWAVRPDWTVFACNRAWTEYSSLTAEDTGALVNWRFMHPADVESAGTKWQEGTAAGVPFRFECRLLRARDNAFRWHSVLAVPAPHQAPGAAGCWIATATDIEERRGEEQACAALLAREKAAREAAEKASRMKDEFLATLSHEMRTPLNAILGWSRMLRSGMIDETRTMQVLATIERSAQVQTELVNDILDVSRIVTGKMRLNVGPIDLGAVVAEAVETMRPAAEAKGVELVYPAPAWAAEMAGDASRLQQVVWSLLSNALKFTPRGGRVDVRLRREGHVAQITVQDTGSGIEPSFLHHVFERFRPADGPKFSSQEGLGLGLAIVKHLVELHGGNVRADSAGIGKGTTFTVSLPIGAVQAAGGDGVLSMSGLNGPCVDRGDPPLLGGVRIVFVDDQPDARELVEEVLRSCGAEVRAVATVEEALEAVTSMRPHLVISDLGLPGEDGYAFIRRVRALPGGEGGNIPAIALTGFARPEDRRRSTEEGFQMHLAKPVEPKELVALVKSLVVARQAADLV